MLQQKFSIILRWDPEEQFYCATIPALAGCVAYGRTREEAIEKTQKTIENLRSQNKLVPERDVEFTEIVVDNE